MATNIPNITQISDGPTRIDPDNFDAAADQLLSIDLPNLTTELQTTIPDMNTAIGETEGYKDTAETYKDIAENAKDIAMAASNFKGNWSDQTGAASIPASYYNNDRLWILLSDLANITASEPSETNTDYTLFPTITAMETTLKQSFLL